MAGENEFQDMEAIDLDSLNRIVEESGSGEEAPEEKEEVEETTQSEKEENEDKEQVDEKSEEQKEESEQEEQQEEEPSSHETDDSSPLTPYAKMLVEEGVLPNLDLENFDGTAESLVQAYEDYDKERFNSFKESSLDPRVKWLQDNLEQGVPLKNLLDLEEQKFSLDNVSEDKLVENESLQKDIITNYYKETTSLNDEKITKIVDRLETLGELESESKSNLIDLKSIIAEKEQAQAQQAQQYQEQMSKQQEQALKQFKDTLYDKKEIIDGVKISDNLKDRVYKTLTTPIGVDENTGAPINKIYKARAEDPVNFEISLGYIFEVTNGFKDWSALAGKKKAIDEFEKSLKNVDLNKQEYKRTKTPRQEESTKNYLKEMENLSKFI